MRKWLAFSAAFLMTGSAWAGPWDNYSEDFGSAFHQRYFMSAKNTARDIETAGQPGMGDTMEHNAVEAREAKPQDILSWDNYSERGSTIFHRDF
jgi:hypothetical protein